jgi:hypothetical protein
VKVKAIARFSCVLSAILVSSVNTVAIAQVENDIPAGSPLMLLIDNSGSMGRCSKVDAQKKCIKDGEKPFKIDDVKNIIRQQLSKNDLSFTPVGVVEIGNLKRFSNEDINKDKKIVCKASENILPIKLHSNDEISRSLDKIKPNDDGTSPISYALNQTINSLIEKKLLPARIILFSDGDPNCGDDYMQKDLCTLIEILHKKGEIKFRLDVIGYKAQKDQTFVDCAKKLPGVVNYYPTGNIKDLTEKVEQLMPIRTNSPSPTSGNGNGGVASAIITGAATLIAAFIGVGFFKGKGRSILVKVVDDGNNSSIAGARVEVLLTSVYTDTNGIARILVKKNQRELKIRVEKEGYEINVRNIDISDSSQQQEEDFKLSPAHEDILFKVVSKDEGKAVEDAAIQVFSGGASVINKYTSTDGMASFPIKKSAKRIKITINKEGYQQITLDKNLLDLSRPEQFNLVPIVDKNQTP